MGQKGCPIGFRLVRNKRWSSIWYAGKQEFGDLLIEDRVIRKFLESKPSCQGASRFIIKRMADKVEVTIHTAKPGLTIGKKGAEIEALKKGLAKVTGKEVWIEVAEIKRPDLEAKLVGENIAGQLKRRIPFRRAMKKAMGATRDAGALGVKVQVSGRVNGAEIARTEWYKDGKIPAHTLRADIDYALVEAQTTYGILGVKVWIYRGEDVVAGKQGAAS